MISCVFKEKHQYKAKRRSVNPPFEVLLIMIYSAALTDLIFLKELLEEEDEVEEKPVRRVEEREVPKPPRRRRPIIDIPLDDEPLPEPEPEEPDDGVVKLSFFEKLKNFFRSIVEFFRGLFGG